MNVIAPVFYTSTPWWQTLAEGIAGKGIGRTLSAAALESVIAGRRAACTSRMKRQRARSERAIARLLQQHTERRLP